MNVATYFLLEVISFVAEKKGWKNPDDVKDTTVRARMDKETVAELDKCCEALGTTRSDIIRSGIKKIYEEISQN